MKKTVAALVVFLMAYLGFLIATLPAKAIVNQFPLPNKLSISGVSGSVWRSEIEQLHIDNFTVEKVNAELSFWSLFTLTPKLHITFGDAFSAGPEGQLVVAFSQEKAKVSDLTLFIKADEVAQQLTLPIPVSAQGDIEVVADNLEIDLLKNGQCLAAKGVASWQRAGVVALEERVKLGQFKADISCENGALALLLSPKNNLGLTFNAYVRNGKRLSGNGFLKPGSDFPQALQSVLPFLGKKDNQGRYRLSF